MSETVARRNLPPGAEKWGREMQDNLDKARNEIARLSQIVGNLSRAISGGLDGVTRIINLNDGEFNDNPYYQAGGGGLAMSGDGLISFSDEDFDISDGVTRVRAAGVAIAGVSEGYDAIAIGRFAYGGGNSSVAIGSYASVAKGGTFSAPGVAVGAGALATVESTSVGMNSDSSPYAVSIGASAEATRVGSIAVGRGAHAEAALSIAIGGDVPVGG